MKTLEIQQNGGTAAIGATGIGTKDNTTKKPAARYTRGEEIFNGVSHIAGGALGIAALIIGILFSARENAGALASVIVYGVSIILMYAMSSLYHMLPEGGAKRLFRIFDHCAIYLLIAGTYTPICLAGRGAPEAWGYALCGALWLLAALGVTLNAVNIENKAVKIYSYISYAVMGWSALFAVVPIVEALTVAGFMWILGGGAVYTVGMLFYACGKRARYIHSVWHLFVLGGTILQFFGVLYYVILV